ncbi:MAG TPA: hypothetical protein VJX67_08865 [Blastocatellia bacterium]|nr:hypothetical protein [Blastocatellia bacterium]
MLAVPFAVLAAGAVFIAGRNVWWLDSKSTGSERDQAPKGSSRAGAGLLLACVPLGFFASSLGCSGLSLHGCSPFCTFVKVGWIPVIALVSGAYYLFQQSWIVTMLVVMSFVPLVPHCLCYNVANGWWIRAMGASPECYIWGFTVSVIALPAIERRRGVGSSALICATIISGALLFFVSHHYFRFPW